MYSAHSNLLIWSALQNAHLTQHYKYKSCKKAEKLIRNLKSYWNLIRNQKSY